MQNHITRLNHNFSHFASSCSPTVRPKNASSLDSEDTTWQDRKHTQWSPDWRSRTWSMESKIPEPNDFNDTQIAQNAEIPNLIPKCRDICSYNVYIYI